MTNKTPYAPPAVGQLQHVHLEKLYGYLPGLIDALPEICGVSAAEYAGIRDRFDARAARPPKTRSPTPSTDIAALAGDIRGFDDPVVDLVDLFDVVGVPAHPELQGPTAPTPPSPGNNGSSRRSSRRLHHEQDGEAAGAETRVRH